LYTPAPFPPPLRVPPLAGVFLLSNRRAKPFWSSGQLAWLFLNFPPSLFTVKLLSFCFLLCRFYVFLLCFTEGIFYCLDECPNFDESGSAPSPLLPPPAFFPSFLFPQRRFLSMAPKNSSSYLGPSSGSRNISFSSPSHSSPLLPSPPSSRFSSSGFACVRRRSHFFPDFPFDKTPSLFFPDFFLLSTPGIVCPAQQLETNPVTFGINFRPSAHSSSFSPFPLTENFFLTLLCMNLVFFLTATRASARFRWLRYGTSV